MSNDSVSAVIAKSTVARTARSRCRLRTRLVASRPGGGADTGEATVVDVSLLGTGLWAMGHAMGRSLVLGASAPLDEWCERLASFEGQGGVVQDTLEAAADPQTVANGYLQECTTAAGTPFRLVAVPVQYDEQPAVPARAPEFNEHGDEILGNLGFDWDAIIDLEARGIVA